MQRSLEGSHWRQGRPGAAKVACAGSRLWTQWYEPVHRDSPASRLTFPNRRCRRRTRGFAESRWVVDFHTRLLKKARVQVADARPAAWALSAEVGFAEEVQSELRGWLETQFREADDIINTPRLSWFLLLWQRCAEVPGVSPRIVTVLRHPATVIDSKLRWYWQGGVDRAAGWLNLTLFTERATRESPRVFVRYDDVLDDWTQSVARVGEVLDLAVIRGAGIVDRGGPRVRRPEVEPLACRVGRLPGAEALRVQADEVWELVSQLADDDGRGEQSVTDALDAAREAYVALYEDAEAIARSSIAAARQRVPAQRKALQPRVVRLSRRSRRVPAQGAPGGGRGSSAAPTRAAEPPRR